MDVRATKFFRIKEEKGQKTYVTGDLIENEKTIEWALKHGFAEKKAASKKLQKPENKATTPPEKKPEPGSNTQAKG